LVALLQPHVGQRLELVIECFVGVGLKSGRDPDEAPDDEFEPLPDVRLQEGDQAGEASGAAGAG